MKLDAEHIRFVLDCMKENTTKIRNIKQYLRAVLFNARPLSHPIRMEKALLLRFPSSFLRKSKGAKKARPQKLRTGRKVLENLLR